MLEEIRISNFAIIDHLELGFGKGLNVITGETGAGKSIIIDAVDLLLGGKSDASMVRSGADKTVIEGTFSLSHSAEVNVTPVLEREGLTDEDNGDALILSREIRANGRSSARINGITVNLDVLSEIGDLLVDVHGQSAHLSLLKPAAHIDLLDRYADLMDTREALATVVNRLGDVRAEIKHLLEDEAAIQRRAERLRHEVEEIDAAELRPGEEDELKGERNRLANSEQLATISGEAVVLLYGDDSAGGQLSALDQIMQVAGLLNKLANIDPELNEVHDLAEEVSAQVEELTISLRRYAEGVEYNPDRLDELEERLEAINTLKRRYGVTVELVLEYADKARAELDGIEHSEERLNELRKQETSMLKHIGELAERISRARTAASKQLSEGIVRELGDLRMARAQFEVAIEQHDDPNGAYVGSRRLAFNETGIDHVEFMMSANPGEPLRPLAKVASGGEAARIMLALKRVLTQADQTPTLIFDEIDQGIGGRVGSVVGEKLWELTGDHQVLVVTHLAQLAGYADRHYRVLKLVDDGRTHTQIVPLTEDFQRVEELASMLGTVNESGFQSARELLVAATDYKRGQRNHEPPAQASLL
ncbi:MAG TPA: DNA repair protein RecN [Phototrophicaceae bacterium]|nr:DNA repair protein RecN [Phototrophicaceae bacterium]